MCGIAGIFRYGGGRPLGRDVQRMTAALRHRGPDGEGFWSDEDAGVALGHRRLVVIDPSPTGAQPMHSADGGMVLTYNGELYNFRELRTELEAAGDRFRGPSDTEVLLAACRRWGVERTLERANGIFAFALWDARRRRLVLARDHLGVKPLFWTESGGRLLFASELKGIRAGLRPEALTVDPDALAAYCRLSFMPAPRTIWRGVYRLPAGTMLTITADGSRREERFFDIASVAETTQGSILRSDREAADALEALLLDAVEKQMVADVPLGALLSGGLDSSLLVALMQRRATRPVKTFTIGFREADFDEAPYAARVAEHLGTEHTELYIGMEHVRDIIPRLAEFFDEPFADASAIPTFLVAQLARSAVTVALAGDGGDELFAGYSRYFETEKVARRVGGIPAPLRRGAAAALDTIARADWLPGRLAATLPPDRLRKLARLLAGEDAYALLTARWLDPPVHGARDTRCPAASREGIAGMQLRDFETYLPEGILTKTDRTGMAVGLEVRVPLLDKRVVEYAWSLPLAMKVRDEQAKWLPRQVLYRYVPPALVDRPKMGFTVPMGSWLRRELRDWADDLLSERALAESGLLQVPPIRRRWREHLSGARQGDHALWPILMFQAWHRHVKSAPVQAEAAPEQPVPETVGVVR